MIKSIQDARITDGIPRILAEQEWVQALSGALGKVFQKTLQYADDSQIYTALDTAPEAILDALAVNWKIDWYDTGFSIERKRRIVKTAMDVRRLMGTVHATKLQADSIHPGTQLEEWFSYNGEPGYFRLFIDITGSSESDPVYADEPEEMERQLTVAKRWSVHMESLSYMVRRKIAIHKEIQSWAYKVPECGTIRCGTYHTPATLGWTERGELTIRPDIEAFENMPELCGTLPEESTKGFSVCGNMRAGGVAAAYLTIPKESGDGDCGTSPEITTKGFSVCGNMKAGAKVQTNESVPVQSGSSRCGTLP